jgi:lipopolysaccharide transport system permease protein
VRSSFLVEGVSGATPFAPLREGWRHRRLVLRLARRRIEERYRGSILGLLWALITPLLLLGVYTFVFSVILQARWGGQETGAPAEFALHMFAGLIVYGIFSECLNEAPGLLHANRVYIKQMVFPIEILPWVSLVAALFRFAASFLLLAVFYGVVRGLPPATALAFPLVLVPVVLVTVGGVWLLSSLGAYLRDLSQVVTPFTTALLFLSPVFYPAEHVPEPLRGAYDLNPFAVLLEGSRGLLFDGRVPDAGPLLGVLVFAWLVAWLGYAWFLGARKGFADVL